MKQPVEIVIALTLWLDATWDDEQIAAHVRTAAPAAFGDERTAGFHPVRVLDVRQEAEVFATERPPDPDELNDDRVSWAETALAAFAAETGCDREDALPDLLCDLKHWCDRTGVSFADELERAAWHYRAEASEVAP